MKNKPTGKCYERAFHYMQEVHSKNPRVDVLLCHGTLLGFSGEVEGIRFGHAWVELSGLVVIDPSLGKRMTRVALRNDYYRYYKINKNKVKKYTLDEMYKTGLENGENYGSWEK